MIMTLQRFISNVHCQHNDISSSWPVNAKTTALGVDKCTFNLRLAQRCPI